MASQCNTRTQMGQMSRTQLERIPAAFAVEEEDNVQLAAAVADNRSRGQHAIVIQRNAPLTPTWIGERWSGNYPDGIFEWRWEDSPRHGPSLDTWGNENGTTGWAIIIRSSNVDFPPGLYRVHQCAHMPCKCSFSPTSMFVQRKLVELNLFGGLVVDAETDVGGTFDLNHFCHICDFFVVFRGVNHVTVAFVNFVATESFSDLVNGCCINGWSMGWSRG